VDGGAAGAGARGLRRAALARGSRADDGDLLAGLGGRRFRDDPAFRRGAVGDRALDRLDGDRVVVDVEGAGGLARRRADAAGDLRKIVGAVQIACGLPPVAAKDQVVPVGDQIVHRAAGRRAGDRAGAVAIGDAAVHAARCLLAILLFGERQHELAPVLDAFLNRLVVAVLTLVFEEPGDLAHALFGRLHGARLLQFGERAAVFERHHLAELP